MPGVGTRSRGAKARLARAQGPRRSLARLLDVLGPRRRVLVHGGMGLLVSHLGGCRGEVLVTLSGDTEQLGSRRAGPRHPHAHRGPVGRVMERGPVGGAVGALKLFGDPPGGETVSGLCPRATRSGHPTAYWELRVLSGFSLLEWFLEPSGLWAERPKLRLLSSALPPPLRVGASTAKETQDSAAKRDSTRLGLAGLGEGAPRLPGEGRPSRASSAQGPGPGPGWSPVAVVGSGLVSALRLLARGRCAPVCPRAFGGRAELSPAMAFSFYLLH